MVRRRQWVFALVGLLMLGLFQPLLRLWRKAQRALRGEATVEDRVYEFGDAARTRWIPRFAAAGCSWPPERLLLVGLKEEKTLEVYAADPGDTLRRVHRFPILAASGGPGPKLREGDRQVPEGFYTIESLNPNSRFHLSLRIDYPNAFDREQAAREGRTALGGDIMIHGKAVSVGCLAMGDEAAEDLFVLAAETGRDRIQVWLCPWDLRQPPPGHAPEKGPDWMDELHAELKKALESLPENPL